MSEELIINIRWSGPHSQEDLLAFSGPTDVGLYAVYATHPVYGKTLVYIGKTHDCFAHRTVAGDWIGGSENDPKNVEFYLGRLIGTSTPDVAEWRRQIVQAEALLIHAHAPAYCTQNIKQLGNENAVANVRVLNSGAVRLLHREVSGLTWTSRNQRTDELRPYGEH